MQMNGPEKLLTPEKKEKSKGNRIKATTYSRPIFSFWNFLEFISNLSAGSKLKNMN